MKQVQAAYTLLMDKDLINLFYDTFEKTLSDSMDVRYQSAWEVVQEVISDKGTRTHIMIIQWVYGCRIYFCYLIAIVDEERRKDEMEIRERRKRLERSIALDVEQSSKEEKELKRVKADAEKNRLEECAAQSKNKLSEQMDYLATNRMDIEETKKDFQDDEKFYSVLKHQLMEFDNDICKSLQEEAFVTLDPEEIKILKDTAEHELKRIHQERIELQREKDRLVDEYATYTEARKQLEQESTSLQTEKMEAIRDRKESREARLVAREEKLQALEDRKANRRMLHELEDEKMRVGRDWEQARHERKVAQDELEKVKTELCQLQEERDQLRKHKNQLLIEEQDLRKERDIARSERNESRLLLQKAKEERLEEKSTSPSIPTTNMNMTALVPLKQLKRTNRNPSTETHTTT
jgi:predicted transposase YbfD/YdcC